jgi:leucyl aminopeptidase
MIREIISVTVKACKADVLKAKTDLLAVGVFSDSGKPSRLCASIDEKLEGAIGKVRELGDFKGKVKSSTVLYSYGKLGAERVLLVGLGEKKKVTADVIRKASGLAASKAVSVKARTAVFSLHQDIGGKIDPARLGQAITEGVYYGSYRYDEFVTEDEDGRLKSLKVQIADTDVKRIAGLCRGVSVGSIIGKAQAFGRTVANRPGNIVNPPALGDIARKMARKTANLSCTVLDDKQLKAKKMGGILAVGGGSASKPRLIVLKYTPAGKRVTATIGLVGKAITFDSGGISIKPSSGMDEMKLDKSGGIAVLAAMQAIAELKPAVCVYGIIPAAENLPSGTSYRPGDIITTYSGKTVEVQNTDAEGRMILCDGLAYAAEQKCETIVDIATLTGACKVALGQHKAALMGNDDGLIKQLQAASAESGEEVWHMPSGEEYLEEMKSKIADLKNIGSRWGGACTAAAFLGQFTGKAKWAHVDMASVDIFSADKGAGGVGATGFGVRLLTSFVVNAAKKK